MARGVLNGEAVIPSDWTGDYCCYSVQWPNSPQWLAVLRGVLILPAYGRYWDSHTGVITTAQDVIRETFDNNLHLQEVLMSCNDSSALTSALNAIAAALTAGSGGIGAGGCCGGSTGGAGQFPPPPSGVDTTGQDPETDPPPEGYDSWEQFEQQRCGVATQILQHVQESLANMTIILATGLDVEGLVEILIVALSLTISSAGLAAIAALILTLGSTLICATALSLVNDHFDELICALLDGSNSSESRAAFLTKWNEIVDAAAIDPVEGFAIKQLMVYMVGMEEINRMYTPNSSIDYSSYDCPGCEEACTDFNDGELHGYTEAVITGAGGSTIETFPVVGSVSPDLDAAKCTSETSGADYATLQSPAFDAHTIVEGDTICFNISEDTTSGTYNQYIDFRLDGAWSQISGATGSIVGINSISLDTYAGQELTGWRIGWSKSGAFNVYVTTSGFNCSEC